MSDDNQSATILAITVVILALILWGCDATRESEITRRIIGTNIVQEAK